MLIYYHIGRLVLSALCVGDLVRLVLGGIRFAGFRVRFHFRKNPSVVSVLNQIIPVHLTRSFFKFQFNIILLYGF